METKLCPKTPKCPIFNGILKGTQYTDTYKRLYCEAGEKGRNECKRYLVALKVGICPPNILPNSSKSEDDIIAEMKQRGELN
ncbi:MAG: hypothetical protein JXJ22_06210 [Bacteroidales bacterium]|nr:hypothetical protein [Bacteroidales bacterium]